MIVERKNSLLTGRSLWLSLGKEDLYLTWQTGYRDVLFLLFDWLFVVTQDVNTGSTLGSVCSSLVTLKLMIGPYIPLQARVACRLAVSHTFAPFDKRHSAGRRDKAANGLPTYYYHQNWENFIPLHVDGVLSSPDFLCHLITALPVWCNLKDILPIHTWAMPKYLKVLYRRLQESIFPRWQTHTHD